jgi:hypothetical protein
MRGSKMYTRYIRLLAGPSGLHDCGFRGCVCKGRRHSQPSLTVISNIRRLCYVVHTLTRKDSVQEARIVL